MSRESRVSRIMLTVLAACLLCGGLVSAKKPPKPPPSLPSYSYTPLGTLGGDFSMVNGMNELGDVVGYSRTADNEQRAFLWTESGGMVDLNGLVSETGWTLQSALDINDQEQIVGSAYRNGKGTSFLYSPSGSVVDIGAIVVDKMKGDGDDTASAEAINNSGDIVGDFVTVPGNYNDAYLLLGGTGEVIPIGLLNGRRTHAKCISNRDEDGFVQVAGVSVDEGGIEHHVFRFTYDTVNKVGVLEDLLGVRSRNTGSGEAINDFGDVAGHLSGRKGIHAFRYTDEDGIEDLGTLGNIYSWARDINLLGDVVGHSQTDDYWVDHGFLYTDEYGMLDLDELVAEWPPEVLGNLRPECINAAGQISGNIQIDTGVYGAPFLLTPVEP